MKRFLLMMLCAATALTAAAEEYDYPYLVFTSNNGTETSVAVDELEITFSNGQLVATNNTGAQTALTLADLASMRFADAAHLPDGISRQSLSDVSSQPSTLYDLSGRQAVRKNDATPVRKGVYVVRKADGSTSKIMVR